MAVSHHHAMPRRKLLLRFNFIAIDARERYDTGLG